MKVKGSPFLKYGIRALAKHVSIVHRSPKRLRFLIFNFVLFVYFVVNHSYRYSMWSCPNCGREFAKPNQAHSCYRSTREDFLTGKEPMVVEIFDKLDEYLQKLGEVRVNYVKNAIIYAAGKSTFAVMKPSKSYLTLEFLLGYEWNKPPVTKVVQYTKTKVAHIARLEDRKDISKEILTKLKEAYKLIVK